jgi:putative CRISPR-associated protein (TIGR02619 family)
MMLSTVGTSLLTNVLSPEQRSRVFKLANATEVDLGHDDRVFLDETAALARSSLAKADRATCKRLSAELNGILTYEDETRSAERTDHVLLATDTYAGRSAADVLQEWILSRKQSCEILVPPKLCTSSLGDFRTALADAVPRISERVNGYRDRHYEVLFNLTGGFKGVQGFMQALAMLHGIEAIYVFETSSELMRIPRLPIGLTGQDIVLRNLALFRRMANNKNVPETDVRAAGIPETLLFIIDGRATLSDWGETIWTAVWKDAASEKLLEPVDATIVFTEHFRRDVKGLAANKVRQVNEAVDALQQWLDGADRHRGRHKIEKLTKPNPPATHELYGWTDQDAGRIFFHLESGKAVIDAVTPHPK